MGLTVYNKINVAFSEINEYEYVSEHMGDRKINATIFSPNKMPFTIGDYVTFRNEKFALFNKPAATKKARTGENIGDSMQYELIFYSPHRIMKNINFEDWVADDDSNQYYTGTSVFYFYNNVTELAVRIKANLDRFLGNTDWTVTVSPDVVFEEMQISVSNLKLWDGLVLANSSYGLDFYISGTNVVIGGSGANITNTFYYGKNKGLYEIVRTYESDENVITRLKTYGASRNLPHDYLRDENGKGRYFTQLMLPDFATTGIDYVDAPSEIIDEYGIIEGVKTFDDVYPSIEEIDLGEGRIDEIFYVENIDLESDYFTIYTRNLGFEISDYWTAETPRLSIKGTNADGDPSYLGGYEFEIMTNETSGTVFKLLKSQTENNILPDNVSTVRAGDRFVLLGIEMPPQYITNAENKLALKAAAYFNNAASVDLSYTVKLDEKFIIENSLSDVFESGKMAKIEDDDLDVANYLTIQSLNIKYGGSILPSYDIKLSNIKSSTLKQEFKKTTMVQSNYTTIVNNNLTSTRISNNLKVDQIGEDLTWQ